jgi:hypothetical protein
MERHRPARPDIAGNLAPGEAEAVVRHDEQLEADAHRNRRLGREQVVDLVDREARALGELVAAGLAAAVAQRLAVGVLELGEVTQRAVGEHHRPGELGDELLHRLAHPPRGVAPERDAALGLEALERAQQPDDALLQQLGALDRR